jgi:hypothetical protein
MRQLESMGDRMLTLAAIVFGFALPIVVLFMWFRL